MANVISGNPYVLDTVGAVFATPSQQKQQTFIGNIMYVDYAVASEVVELTDSEGRVVWRASGHDDFSPVDTHDIGWVKGLIVSALTAPGRVLVFLRP